MVGKGVMCPMSMTMILNFHIQIVKLLAGKLCIRGPCFYLIDNSIVESTAMNTFIHYQWITDSTSSIRKVEIITMPSDEPRHYPDDIDYETAIRKLHKSLHGRKLHPTWVKGHQDDTTTYENLSPDARLNVDVDSLA